MRFITLLFCILVSFSYASYACSVDDIIVSDVVISKPMKGKDSTSGYMTIRNKCSEDIELIGVEAPFQNITELHDMKHEGGVMKMHKVDSIKIAKNSVLHLKRGGMHVMFMKLEKNLDTKNPIKLKIKFNNNLTIEVPAIFKEIKGIDSHKKY